MNDNVLELTPPKPFSFDECMIFLNRSDKEILHRCQGNQLFKLLKIEGKPVLVKVREHNEKLQLECLTGSPSPRACEHILGYFRDWFDLSRDITPFYQLSEKDPILKKLTTTFYGLRMIGLPDFFEAMAWAILGQQINLSFAYTLKARFVTTYGESMSDQGVNYWLFPEPEVIARLTVDDLRDLQITTRKAEYLIGVAQAIVSGDLTREKLRSHSDTAEVKKTLMAIRGVGAWTADYVMMKNLGLTSAFPVGDAGLQNALKAQLGLTRKPTLEEMLNLSENWSGWEAYATFYLWRSLYEPAL